MKDKVCSSCGQVIPQPEGRLICCQCQRPIKRGQSGWTHGGDGRPRHKDCNAAQPQPNATMELLS